MASSGRCGSGMALGELPGPSEPISPQLLVWKGSGGQTQGLQYPQAPRKAVNPAAAGGPGYSVHAVSLLRPQTIHVQQTSRKQVWDPGGGPRAAPRFMGPKSDLCPRLSMGSSPALDPASFCLLPCKTDPTPFLSLTPGHTPLLFQKVGRGLPPKPREPQSPTESAVLAGW